MKHGIKWFSHAEVEKKKCIRCMCDTVRHLYFMDFK